jgi:hypothetical protein
MIEELNADYVIIGSGAIGMAFADTILSESDATIIIIDRYAKPGGHWNVAYPFVQLHQPSAFYGVSSKELSSGRVEQEGLNAGLGELSGGAEVSAYFEDVMRHATAKRKTVDATYLKTTVPKTHTPNFEIGDGVRFMPLNDLPTVTSAPDNYVVVGAGKTGIDACLWLLEQHVEPTMITWIVSREAWLLDRQNTQMTEEFFFDTIGTQAEMVENIAQSESPDDMFKRLEQCGYFLRIDESTTPEMFHAATVSKLEIKQLRRIKNIVRLGHLTSISTTEMKFKKGVLPTTANTLYIDCSASAIVDPGGKPVFSGNLITPQLVRPYQPVFSASLIAHVELNYDSEAEQNRLCGLVPLPNTNVDFIRFTAAALINQYHWSQDDKLQKWISGNRLDGATTLLKSIAKDDTEKWAVVDRIRKNSPLAAVKLLEFQAALSEIGK